MSSEWGVSDHTGLVYSIVISLLEEVSRKTRSSFDGEIPPVPLPFKMSTICELIVFVKNLELSSKCKLLKRPQRIGSRSVVIFNIIVQWILAIPNL